MKDIIPVIVVIIVMLIIYYVAVIIIEKDKKDYKNLTETEIRNLKKKSIRYALLGFLIGILIIFIASFIFWFFILVSGLGIFLLAAGEYLNNVSIIYVSIIPFSIPFLTAFVGWRFARRSNK